jgi:hypothetical protein
MADYSIDVRSDAYANMRLPAALMVCVWPVGVPLVIAVLLWRSRAPLLEMRRREKVLGRGAYNPAVWATHVEKQRRLMRVSAVDAYQDERDEQEFKIEGYLWALTVMASTAHAARWHAHPRPT